MVCYDVPAKRTEMYKRLLKEYLVHEQESVFMGDLPESELIKLVSRIAKTIGPEDQVLRLVCKNRHNIEITSLSKDAKGDRCDQPSMNGMARIGRFSESQPCA